MTLKERAEAARIEERKLWEAMEVVKTETQSAIDRRDAALRAWHKAYKEAEALELVAKLEEAK